MIFFILAGLYVAAVIGLSYYYSRKETREDYLNGDHHLSAWPLAISLGTSWISGGALVFMIYMVADDLPGYLFMSIGVVANLLIFAALIKKPYELARKNNWMTMTEVVHGMIGRKSAVFTMFYVLILFSTWTLYELIGSGLLLSSLTGLNYTNSVMLICGVIGVYIYLGGFKSLVRTDLIQGAMMVFVLITCFILAEDAKPIDLKTYFVDKPSLTILGFFAMFFSFFALQFSESTIWQRVLAAKSVSDAQKSLLYTNIFYLINYGLIIALIILGLSYFPDAKNESIYGLIANEQLGKWIGPLFLVALLGITMSTIDTILFIAAQCLSTDAADIQDKHLERPRFSLRIALVGITCAVIGLSLLTQDIQAVFWFILAIWVALTPMTYILWPVKIPTDNAVLISMIVLAIGISGLYLVGLYQTHYVIYSFVIGLTLPKALDFVIDR